MAPTPESLPCDSIDRIEVTKSTRTLRVLCVGGGERSWPVALGREPVGPKREAGDSRTPEGEYHLRSRGWESRFHRFLIMDYPSREDAAAGLRAGLLSLRSYGQILDAHDRSVLPPQNTALGGLVGFHGEGERWNGDSEYLNWTNGCIAMTDEQIDFLSAHATWGTLVTILP
ncbi:MAG TPA: L,D-transpeptidase family protein [Myxococcota bacterium]|nr:L,D-transpeptidase family protein [Myxococcota bacterium]